MLLSVSAPLFLSALHYFPPHSLSKASCVPFLPRPYDHMFDLCHSVTLSLPHPCLRPSLSPPLTVLVLSLSLPASLCVPLCLGLLLVSLYAPSCLCPLGSCPFSLSPSTSFSSLFLLLCILCYFCIFGLHFDLPFLSLFFSSLLSVAVLLLSLFPSIETQAVGAMSLFNRDGIFKLLKSSGIDSTSLCSRAGRYDTPVPSRFLVPIHCYKTPSTALMTIG
jgi:hypothetical protein